MKVAIFFERFGPYHMARLSAASKVLEVLGVEFSELSSEYKWGYESGSLDFPRVTLAKNSEFSDLKWATRLRLVNDLLAKEQPEAVAVSGWFSCGARVLIGLCYLRGVPVVMMSETNADDFKRSLVGEFLKRIILKPIGAAIVGGARHRHYLISLGIPDSVIRFGYNVVDNDYFNRETSRVRVNDQEIRKRHNLPGRYFLVSARFIEKKNLIKLLECYALYREQAIGELWDIVLLGDGVLRGNLEQFVKENHLDEWVHFRGFVQYAELPDFYGTASAFLLLSTTEQWGLVVNEALASGLPVVVSSRCGCAEELVQEESNGFIVDPDSDSQIVHALIRISSPKIDREEMSRAALSRIEGYSPARFGSGLAEAVSQAVDKKTRLSSKLIGLLLIAGSLARNWW